MIRLIETACLAQLTSWAGSPQVWGLALAALGLAALFGERRLVRRAGALAGLLGIALIGWQLPAVGPLGAQLVFWLLAVVTLGAGAAAVSAHSPVYTALWFALCLLGVAGLLLFQDARFLGVATVVVYAGAIVVTFLFVLMLAQPAGQAVYDRLSWSRFAVPAAVVTGALLVAVLVAGWDPAAASARERGAEVAGPDHMARLGAEMFGRHLVAVEVAGTLLLVALIGAIAIVIHGRPAVQDDAAGRPEGRST